MAPSVPVSSSQDDMAFFTSILKQHNSPLSAPQNISVLQMEARSVEQVQSKEDVTIYVGSKRRAYVLSIHSLRGSAYLQSLITSLPISPIVLDCEESVFENVLTILRYGSFSALPPMPTSHMFQLKRELEFLGIPLPVDSSSQYPSPSSSSSSSSVSVSSNISSVSLGSPSPSRRSLSGNAPVLAELPEFLGNQEKLMVVSRIDGDRRWQCPSCEDDSNEWALNFQHRHAFCTACGQPAIPIMLPKFLAEMFMAAASYYSGRPANPRIWSIGSNSACTLSFLSFANSHPCPSCSSLHDDGKWAVSCYFSHAFCTGCGGCANAKTLLDLLFKCRYGSRRQIKSVRSSNSLDSKIENNISNIGILQ